MQDGKHFSAGCFLRIRTTSASSANAATSNVDAATAAAGNNDAAAGSNAGAIP